MDFTSIVRAKRLTRNVSSVFPHGDLEQLARMYKKER